MPDGLEKAKNDAYNNLRREILKGVQGYLYAELKRKPNWTVEEIKKIFEEAKDRV